MRCAARQLDRTVRVAGDGGAGPSGRAATAGRGDRAAAAGGRGVRPDRFPGQAALAGRLRQRHTELQRGRSAGFWRITVAAGGADQASAARVAGLLCASTRLDALPYALNPAPGSPPGPGQPHADPDGDGVPGLPGLRRSTDLLAALARPPEAEVPGVRFAVRPEFDVTPETGLTGTESLAGIELGQVLDRNLMPAGPFARPGRVTQPACVRLRGDRSRQVADRPLPA